MLRWVPGQPPARAAGGGQQRAGWGSSAALHCMCKWGALACQQAAERRRPGRSNAGSPFSWLAWQARLMQGGPAGAERRETPTCRPAAAIWATHCVDHGLTCLAQAGRPLTRPCSTLEDCRPCSVCAIAAGSSANWFVNAQRIARRAWIGVWPRAAGHQCSQRAARRRAPSKTRGGGPAGRQQPCDQRHSVYMLFCCHYMCACMTQGPHTDGGALASASAARTQG